MKSEKGSITLFVLIAMIFFLVIAFTAYVSASSKLQGQNSELERIKASYGQDLSEEGLATIYDELTAIDRIYTSNSTINDGEASSTNPTIPAGFKPVNTETSNWGDGTNAPSLSAINAGLVIEDKDGNQFVWVPVDGTNIKYEKHSYATNSIDDTNDTTTDTGNGDWKTYYYRNYSDWTDDGGNATSVEKYGGFYIARYEAGVPSNANFYANSNGATYSKNEAKNVTTYTPVSKANNQVWNYITQENAKTVSAKMYNNESVKSSLIDSYAWDATSHWLSNGGSVTDSRTWGNYANSESFTVNGLYALHADNDGWQVASTYSKGQHTIAKEDITETATGITDRNKANNIYDFAGNMFEWTTEVGTHNGTADTYAVRRGGCFHSYGDDSGASYRNGEGITSGYSFGIGFRVVLYLE